MFLRITVLLTLAAALTGCGAGLITGIFATRNRGGSPAPAPSIAVSESSGPLSIEADEFFVRRATLRNVALPDDPRLLVKLSWPRSPGETIEAPQKELLLTRLNAEWVLTWVLATKEIAARVADVTAEDVDTELVVSVDRGPFVEEVIRTPFRLLRQPVATLVPNQAGRDISLISVAGGELTFEVRSLPTSDVRDLVVEVATAEPSGATPVPRAATNVRAVQVPATGVTEVSCMAPSNGFPTELNARVVHRLAGRSTPIVGKIYYHPELTAAVSRRGSADGGEVITLTGQGMVPLDFEKKPATLDFSKIQIIFRKGGSETALGPQFVRPSLSSSNNVVVLSPASPDGKPGPATIEFRAFVAPIQVSVTKTDIFAYGAASPNFEPRGIGLAQLPVAMAFGQLTRPLSQTDQAVDAAVLFSDAVGVPFVQVYESRENGMFSRLGFRIQASDRGNPNERWPIDLAFGEFSGDDLGDLFVANSGDLRAFHTLLQGVSGSGKALEFKGVAHTSSSAPAAARPGDFNSDGLTDLLLAGGLQPELTTETLLGTGATGFQATPVWQQPVAGLATSRVVQLDDDGHPDLVFVVVDGGTRIHVAYGDAVGGFADRQDIDLSNVPGVQGREAISVRTAGPGPDRAVLVVLRDLVDTTGGLLVADQTSRRTFGAPRVQEFDNGRRLTHVHGADFDGDGVDEIVLGFSGGPLTLWKWDNGDFVEVVGAIDLGDEPVGTIHDLDSGLAVPKGVAGGARDIPALFLTHTVNLGQGVVERRLATLLSGDGVELTDPVSRFDARESIRSVAVGTFRLRSTPSLAPAADVAVCFDDEIAILENDGVGRLAEKTSVPVGGLIEETFARIGGVAGVRGTDRLLFLLADGRIGSFEPSTPAPLLSSSSLLELVGGAPGTATLESGSRIVAGDVDGDGVDDLAVLLVVRRPSTAIETVLCLCRGRTVTTQDPFPFRLPDPSIAQATLPVRATSLTLGDFALDAATRRLEAAVAVPEQGSDSGVHFFHYDPGDPAVETDDRFVRSVLVPSAPLLAASLDPALLSSIDLDGDGFDDLCLVSGTLDSMYLFRQTGVSTQANAGVVDPRVFGQSAQLGLPPGRPVAIQIGDIDGDRVDDLVVHVRETTGTERHRIGAWIANGVGGISTTFTLPDVRLGNLAMKMDLATGLGDLNGDGAPDLVLAWGADPVGQQSQVRMLFTSHR